ncbi:MAG: hypothetical protein ACFE8B_15530 [Candidatus Hermodarchaeota archaeon]
MDTWKEKLANQSKESFRGDKRFEKALEIISKHFPEFRWEKSPKKKGSILNGEEIIILTSNFKLITGIALAITCSLVLIPFSFAFPLVNLNVIITYIVIIIGIFAGFIIYSMLMMKFFIVLNFQGIYYKRTTEPQLIAWGDVSKITAKQNYGKYGTPANIVVKIHIPIIGSFLTKEVRFSSSIYRNNFLNGTYPLKR